MEKFLTFIVPVYNTGEVMIPTMNSLLSQSKNDFDVIIVNDGSTDTISYDLCQKYADNFENISVIHQANKGIGGARNEGFRHTKTKYVIFFDSDDILDHNFVKLFYELTEKIPDASFYICEPACFDNSKYTIFPWYDVQKREKIPNNIPLSSLEEKINVYGLEGNPCTKIYNTQFLLNFNFEFPEKLFYEDFIPHHFLLYNSESVVVSDLRLFYYRTNNAQSITGRSDACSLDILWSFEEMLDYFLSVNVDSSIRVQMLQKTLSLSTWIILKSQDAVRREFVSKLPMILLRYPLKDISKLEGVEKLKFFVLRRKIWAKIVFCNNITIALSMRMTDFLLKAAKKLSF